MPIVFSNNCGKAVSIPDSVAEGAMALVGISDAIGDISFSTMKTIITRVGVSVAGNYQFLHTLGNDVYVYVFGDRMGQVVIHGLSFSDNCNREQRHGFELLYDWYKANRLAAKRDPITITIGKDTTFRGFVLALNADAQDAVNRTIQFQITLTTLPGAA